MVMPYLSQVSITWSSRTEPPVCAMYATPLLCARSILSPNGKKASDPNDTPFMVSSHARFSSRVSTFGFLWRIVARCRQPKHLHGRHWYRHQLYYHDLHGGFFYPRQIHYFRMLAQIPYIRFITGKTCTVDAALLAGTDADNLSVFYITNRITLCIF